jgi:hypothetical protein
METMDLTIQLKGHEPTIKEFLEIAKRHVLTQLPLTVEAVLKAQSPREAKETLALLVVNLSEEAAAQMDEMQAQGVPLLDARSDAVRVITLWPDDPSKLLETDQEEGLLSSLSPEEQEETSTLMEKMFS